MTITAKAEQLDVRDLRAKFGISRERMAQLLGVSSKTIERWEAKHDLPLKDPLRMARLAAMREIADLGLIVYKPEGFVRLLRIPVAEFGERTALDLIALGDTEPVYAALASDYEGLGY